MKVKDCMTQNPYTIAPEATLAEAFELMKKHNIRRLPVLDRGKLAGIISITDVYLAAPAPFMAENAPKDYMMRTRVRDVVPQTLPVTVDQEAYVEQAAKIMADSKVTGMPVVDEDGRLVGVISVIDIMNAFLQILGVNRKGTRINLRVQKGSTAIQDIVQILVRHEARIANLVQMESKDENDLLVIRIDTLDYEGILNDIKAAGFEVESIITKE